jgi:hypothetical protein
MEQNWKPLEMKLGPARCVGLMFMGRVNGINLYKHGITRTYPNLGNNVLDSSIGICYDSACEEQNHERTKHPSRSDNLLL